MSIVVNVRVKEIQKRLKVGVCIVLSIHDRVEGIVSEISCLLDLAFPTTINRRKVEVEGSYEVPGGRSRSAISTFGLEPQEIHFYTSALLSPHSSNLYASKNCKLLKIASIPHHAALMVKHSILKSQQLQHAPHPQDRQNDLPSSSTNHPSTPQCTSNTGTSAATLNTAAPSSATW